LAAGGTGGHLFPAEALAAELRCRGARPVLITDRRGDRFGGALASDEIRTIRAGGLAGRSLTARLGAIVELGLGFIDARRHLRRLRPRVVVGFGGYASVPTVLAASVAGFPTVVHEQNAVLGRANRMLAARVQQIASAFEKLAALPPAAAGKVVRTGMPVRPAFVPLRDQPYQPPEDGGPVRLVVLGGSQGAQVFSELLPAAVERLGSDLRRRLRITQQCRPETLDAVRDAYARADVDADLAAFFDNVPALLADAHIIVARAGASTVAELTTVGRPAVLVPYPFAIDDHQAANAEALAEIGAAWVMPQSTLSADALADRLTGLVAAPDTLAAAAARARAFGRPEAASRLADLLLRVATAEPAASQAGGLAA
jgi:UDP-N-acetylglucosamine--N-acetylmuramyl-(pentapeptide) pyrophosphoryl-undecaprenol N-acetylglucosamine transferase